MVVICSVIGSHFFLWQSKENQALQDEVERLISEKNSLENDNGVLESNFDAAQKQCRDLIEVIQALKQENSYYKGAHFVGGSTGGVTKVTLQSIHNLFDFFLLLQYGH